MEKSGEVKQKVVIPKEEIDRLKAIKEAVVKGNQIVKK